MPVIGRFAESEDPVLYASYGEVDKCEFIKVNAPKEAWEAWSSTDDDGAGLLVKAGALREQAREVLVSAGRSRTLSPPQPAMWVLTCSTLPLPSPPRPPQGQKVRLAAMKESAPMKEPAAAVKKETMQASCRPIPLPPPSPLTNLLHTYY